jgi:hypothetical protein
VPARFRSGPTPVARLLNLVESELGGTGVFGRGGGWLGQRDAQPIRGGTRTGHPHGMAADLLAESVSYGV